MALTAFGWLHLHTLPEETSKLSGVAKYLPQHAMFQNIHLPLASGCAAGFLRCIAARLKKEMKSCDGQWMMDFEVFGFCECDLKLM